MKLQDTAPFLIIGLVAVASYFLLSTARRTDFHNLRASKALEQIEDIKEKRCAIQTALIVNKVDSKLVTKRTVEILLETCMES